MVDWANSLKEYLGKKVNSIPLILMCDDADFVSETYNNFLWTTFTRANPSHDIYGIDSFTKYKHWACKGSLILTSGLNLTMRHHYF